MCFGARASPSNNIKPLSGNVIWLIILIKDVFPAPFGPNNPKTLSFGMFNETLFNAVKSPYVFTTFFTSNKFLIKFDLYTSI